MAVEQRQLCRHRRDHCRWCGATEELSLADAGHERCATQQRSGDGGGGVCLGAESPQCLALVSRHREKLLEEAADFALAVDEGNFQNPVAWLAVRVRLA